MPGDQFDLDDGRPSLEAVKKMRREYPSGWMELAKDPARALLIDALLDSPPGYEFTPPQISERAGISDESVRNHIGILVELGLVDHRDSGKYELESESRVMMELERLNSAVTAIQSGIAEKAANDLNPDYVLDNSDVEDDDGARDIPSPPSTVTPPINAD